MNVKPKNLKYIRSNTADQFGETLYSGDEVLVTDRLFNQTRTFLRFSYDNGFTLDVDKDFLEIKTIKKLRGANPFQIFLGALRMASRNIFG